MAGLTEWQKAVKAAKGDMGLAAKSYCKKPRAARAKKNRTGASKCRGGRRGSTRKHKAITAA